MYFLRRRGLLHPCASVKTEALAEPRPLKEYHVVCLAYGQAPQSLRMIRTSENPMLPSPSTSAGQSSATGSQSSQDPSSVQVPPISEQSASAMEAHPEFTQHEPWVSNSESKSIKPSNSQKSTWYEPAGRTKVPVQMDGVPCAFHE